MVCDINDESNEETFLWHWVLTLSSATENIVLLFKIDSYQSAGYRIENFENGITNLLNVIDFRKSIIIFPKTCLKANLSWTIMNFPNKVKHFITSRIWFKPWFFWITWKLSLNEKWKELRSMCINSRTIMFLGLKYTIFSCKEWYKQFSMKNGL